MATSLFTWAKLLESLYEMYDKVSECLDWLAWSQEATGNVAIGRAPPPLPWHLQCSKTHWTKPEPG